MALFTIHYENSSPISVSYTLDGKIQTEIIDDMLSASTIVQIDKEGKVVREYTSLLEICQAFNVPRADNVRNVLNGKQKGNRRQGLLPTGQLHHIL